MDQNIQHQTNTKPAQENKPEQKPVTSTQEQIDAAFKNAEFTTKRAQDALIETSQVIKASEKAQKRAELARNKAESSRKVAEAARNIAELSRTEAETERSELKKSEKLLQQALKKSEIAKQLSEKALQDSQKAKQESLIAQRKAEFAETRYHLVLEGSNDGVWDWDIQKNIVFWNGRFFNMLGFKDQHFSPKDKTLFNLVPPEEQSRFTAGLQKALTLRHHFEDSFRIKNVQGDYLDCLFRGKTFFDEQGHPIRMAGTITDITERKRLEQELAQAKEEAETANHRKTEVLRFVSHDFKNPLNAIIGYSAMLEQEISGELTEKQKKYAHNINISGNHLLAMVTDILDIARSDSGKITLKPQPVQWHPFIEEMLAILEPTAKQKQVAFNTDIASDLPEVKADSTFLRQILLNLFSNAIKYNRMGGKVFIRVFKTPDQKWVACEIQDMGIGISKELIPKVFSEFYRVENPQSKTEEGTGLGLPLAKKLVELHGGSISADSEVGVGSTFTFKLPVSQPQG